MAEVISLESPVSARPERSRLPHFSVMADPLVCADIVEPDFPGVSAVRGIAMGTDRPATHSGIGMFRDNVGNTIIVMIESTDVGKIIIDRQLWGPSATIFRIDRPKGGGWGYAAIPILNESDTNKARTYIRAQTGASGSHNQNGIAFTNFWDLLRTIEARQIKFDGAIVCMLSGIPIVLTDALSKIVLGLAVTVCKTLGSSFGISGAIIDAVEPVLHQLIEGRPVSFMDIAAATTLITPASIRPYIERASTAYQAASTGDYLAAAQALGITEVKAVQDLYAAASSAIQSTTKNVSSVLKSTQSWMNIDTVNKLRNQLISGSVLTKIIDEGSVTRVPVMQNVMTCIMSGGFVGTLPNVSDMVSTALNKTSDAVTGTTHRALLHMALGRLPNQSDAWELTQRSLTEQAILQARYGGKMFFMPAGLPPGVREQMGVEIGKQAGVNVVTQTMSSRREFY